MEEVGSDGKAQFQVVSWRTSKDGFFELRLKNCETGKEFFLRPEHPEALREFCIRNNLPSEV
jgi:hypothetical protein